MKKFFFIIVLYVFCCGLLYCKSLDNYYQYLTNPRGWSLPDKKLFFLDSEKTINLGGELNIKIIQQIYKYNDNNKDYHYYIEKFDDHGVYLDEFYRFLINDYYVYLIRTKDGEKVLFYNISTFAERGVFLEDGSYETTEWNYGFSVLLTDFNLDGCFDRLYPLSGGEPSGLVLTTKEDIEKAKDYFPFRKMFLHLLTFYDLSFLDNKK